MQDDCTEEPYRTLLHPDAVARRGSCARSLLARRWLAAAAALVALTTARAAVAATCYWAGSGTGNGAKFSRSGNWTCSGGPGTTDDVVFAATSFSTGSRNAACTFDQNIQVASITITSGYTKTISGGNQTVTVTNGWSQANGTFSGESKTMTLGSLSVTGGSFTSTSNSQNGMAVSGGMTVSGGTVSGGGGAISVGGTLTVNGGTFTPLTSNLTVTGDIDVTAGSSTTGTFTGSTGTITTTGNLSIDSGASFTASSTTTQITGNFTNSASFTASTGTVILVGTGSGGTITTGGYSFNGLTVNGSGGTYTLQDALTTSGTLTVTAGTLVTGSKTVTLGGLTINGGTFNAPTGTMTLSGAFNHSTGTFTAPAGSTVFFSGTGTRSHTFGGAVFANVQVGLGTSGMVGYWKLDESSGTSAADSSGVGNTGTYHAGGVTHTASIASSISFTDSHSVTLDGSTGYVTLGTTSFPPNNAAQSISLWFQGTPVSGTNQNMIALINSSGASANQLGFRDLNLVVWSYGGTALVSTAAPTDGAWHQVIYTYDGVTDSLYLDGTLASSSTTAVHQTSTPATAYLGTYSPNNEMWNGSLDDVRVYNRALTAGEISLLAGGGSPSTISGTHTFSDAFACTGDFSILAGTVTGTGTFSVAGDWFNAGTFSSTGTVTLTGTSATGNITTGGSSFGALTLNGSGGTYTLQDNLAVTGNLTITAGTLSGSRTVTVGGNFSNSGAFSSTGTVTLTSSSAGATLQSGTARFSALTINGTGTYTLQDKLWVPGGTITLTKGTLAAGTNTVVAGAFSTGAGTATMTSATLILDGTSSQALPFATLGGLRIEDPSENNLVGYWKMDEGGGRTLKDYSGNGNTGTLATSGVTWTTSSLPSLAFDNYSSVTLDGSNGYASVGTANLPATDGAITISAWVYLNGLSGNQNVVALSGGSGNSLQLGLRGGVYTVWTSGLASSMSGPAATTGAWHHVAYTYDGTSNVIYVDGTAYASSFTHQSGATTGAYIGTFSGLSEKLNGALDDVRIYNAALTASQINELYAGRYAGTGGVATITLNAASTVSGLLSVDSGTLSGNGRSMSVTGSTAAVVNTGTYNVGTAAQKFSGGLTVNGGGALTLASSGGSVQIGSGKTLTIDGTLNASSSSAIIQPLTAGTTYSFKVGSTSSATPTLNISGLKVQGTLDGMQIGASTSSSATFTEFDGVIFSGGSGAQYLSIKAKSLFLSSSGCEFDAGQLTGGPTKAVTIAGDGTADGETRALFGGTICAANWYVSSSNKICTTTAKSDDDANNDGVADNPSSNGAVAQFISAASSDTAGSVVGFPTAAFDWTTFTNYSTYVAFHNGSGGTSDVIYVRDASGNPLYSWTVPTPGESITGTPQWTTSGGTHYVYVATTQGHVYRLIDVAGTSGSLTLDSTGWATNPFDCGCTISTPLTMDGSNLYWGSTTSGKNFWTLGKATESSLTPVSITPTVTSTSLTVATIGGTSYAYMGVTGDFLKIDTQANSITDSNTLPGTQAVNGRVVVAMNNTGTWRLYGGDGGGTMWAIDPGSSFSSSTPLWSYSAGSSISGSAYYDYYTDTLQFGTDGGAIVALDSRTGAVVVGGGSGYPYTPSAGDAITAAPLFTNGVLVVGSTGGKLYFLDRNNGAGVTLLKQYNFGANEAVSGVGYDANGNHFMVTTANASNKDGKLYYFDLITDPTPGSN